MSDQCLLLLLWSSWILLNRFQTSWCHCWLLWIVSVWLLSTGWHRKKANWRASASLILNGISWRAIASVDSLRWCRRQLKETISSKKKIAANIDCPGLSNILVKIPLSMENRVENRVSDWALQQWHSRESIGLGSWGWKHSALPSLCEKSWKFLRASSTCCKEPGKRRPWNDLERC